MGGPLQDEELERYSRHIILKEVGGAGQAKLKAAHVLIVGAGGLGAPLLQYLVAAGVGTITLVDDDTVALSNLQRQVIYRADRLGESKVAEAKSFAQALNPALVLDAKAVRLSSSNAESLIDATDIVADGSDNFDTRFLVADVAAHLHKPLVSAALGQFDGQISTFKPYQQREKSGLPGQHTPPCYRCLFPAPPEGAVENCAEGGILGAVAGVMGTLQATEVLKEILGIGDSLAGKLLLYDALGARHRTVRFPRDPACVFCSGKV
ncbi:MAG: HesA/MoeB/ThiF family protein [Alphaproteobacteria bacterium]